MPVLPTRGLGIGANTAIFSVIYGVLLKPLPYADSDRLEFGVRMAPGASRNTVLRMVIGQGLKLVGMGLAVGILASAAATRVLTA